MVKKILSGLTIGVLFLTSITPGFAATTVKIKGNGKYSKNTVKVTNVDMTHVGQHNTTLAGVLVVQAGNTGKNKIKDTNGGDATIETGNVQNTATVTVTGGDNTATLSNPCGCEEGDTTVVIKNNGRGSTNTAEVTDVNITHVSQSNMTGALIGIIQLGNTGINEIKDTTGGDGDPLIDTGNVTNTATVTVTGGDNTATL